MSALLPAEPLVELVRKREVHTPRQRLAQEIAGRTDRDPEAVRRFLERLMAGEHAKGVQNHTGDTVATGLGVHPASLWGQDYWVVEDEEEEVSFDVGHAIDGLENELEAVQEKLDGLDREKAELVAKQKELRSAIKALERIIGDSGRTTTAIGGHACDECDKVLPTRQGLSTHKTKMHRAA